MELKFRAETMARLEDSDMLGMSIMELFFGDAMEKVGSEKQMEDTIKRNSLKVFMSLKKLVMIISAGYDNDMKKAFEVYEQERIAGKSQVDIGNEVMQALTEGNWFGGVEKKVVADSPSENNGKTTK